MIRINQVKLPVEHTTEALHKKVQELLKYKGSMDVEIVKRPWMHGRSRSFLCLYVGCDYSGKGREETFKTMPQQPDSEGRTGEVCLSGKAL